MGAAIATVVAYTLLFVGIAWRAQRVFPVSYQGRRVAFFFFQAEGGIRDCHVTGVQTCALPISMARPRSGTIRPSRSLRRVDLPAPLEPTRPVQPRSTVTSTERRAWTEP